MSNDVIISVENLGKKYRIIHQGEKQRYTALRDVISQKLAAPFKFLKSSPLRPGREQGEVIEGSSNPTSALCPRPDLRPLLALRARISGRSRTFPLKSNAGK